MDFIFIIILLAIFLVPSFLMARSQKKRQAEMVALQNSVQTGDKIVTVSGFHATIVDTHDSTLTLELSPGVEATMDRAGVMRKIEDAELPTGEVPGSAGSYWADQQNDMQDTTEQHPENFPPEDPHSEQGGAR